MTTSPDLLLLSAVYFAIWVPVVGLLWLARRRENDRMGRLLREAVGRTQLHHISRGRRN